MPLELAAAVGAALRRHLLQLLLVYLLIHAVLVHVHVLLQGPVGVYLVGEGSGPLEVYSVLDLYIYSSCAAGVDAFEFDGLPLAACLVSNLEPTEATEVGKAGLCDGPSYLFEEGGGDTRNLIGTHAEGHRHLEIKVVLSVHHSP